jgi:ubiquinone/menaquinone biosynthesis C-methylase UbiE
MSFFSRRSRDSRDPLAVVMSGVRLGERVLQVGVDDPRLVGQIAAKAGLSGTASCVVADQNAAARVKAGADAIGVLVDVAVAPPSTVPHPDGDFDVAVVHSASGYLAALSPADRMSILRECLRVLRPGGRTVVIETGTRGGIGALLHSAPASQASYEASGGSVVALEQAGFAPVRPLGDREGLKFSEGLKTTTTRS